MATVHIESNIEEIAPVVIMPGDPLRAKFIAENFLENAILVNHVRNILAYTGFYKGKKVTVFASGMGTASMGIYAYELFKFYNVEEIIRIGSVGSYDDTLNLFDLILVDNSFTTSNFAMQYDGESCEIVDANLELNQRIQNKAYQLNKPITLGNIHCSDVFYSELKNLDPKIKEYNCLGVEMESFALLYIAKRLNKKAATILTVSDFIGKNLKATREEREKSLTDMILLALESVSNKF